MLVRELGVVDGETPLQILATDLREPTICLGVDARDEEARHRRDVRRVAPRLDQPLEPADERLGDGRVALEREDERDVDRATRGDRVLDRAEAGLGCGDLHVHVLPSDELVQELRLLERVLPLVGEIRIDLDRDEPVDAVGALPHRQQQIAGALDVLDREREEDLLRVVGALELGSKLLVVPVSGRESLLEDRRVRSDADNGVLLDQPLELAGLEHLAREGVDPDADSALRKLVQPAARHASTLAVRTTDRRMARVTTAERRQELGQQFRVDSVRMSAAAGSGHPTSAMSAADLLAVLVDGYLRYDFSEPKSPANDRLVFSKGHASTLLYAIYRAAGVVSDEEILDYRTYGSMLEGHPTPRIPWVDVATGSLGQGLPIGVGMALAAKQLERLPTRVWVLCGDSEMAEGSMWEAFEHAAHFELDNLTAIIDVNRLGQRGETMVGWNLDAYLARAEAFGWNAIEVDGHDVEAIDDAFGRAVSTTGRPTVVIARTLKGKGVAAVENQNGWHGKPLEDPDAAIAELGGPRNIRVEVAKPDRRCSRSRRRVTARASSLRARSRGRDPEGVR